MTEPTLLHQTHMDNNCWLLCRKPHLCNFIEDILKLLVESLKRRQMSSQTERNPVYSFQALKATVRTCTDEPLCWLSFL